MADLFMYIVYLVGLILCCVHVLGSLYRLARFHNLRRLREVLASLRGLRGIFRSTAGGQDAAGILIRQRMEAESLRVMRDMAGYSAHGFVLITISVLQSVYGNNLDRWMTPGQDVVVVAYCFAQIALTLRPGLIRSETLLALYLFETAFAMIIVVLMTPLPLGAVATTTFGAATRFAWSFAYLNPLPVAAVSALAFAVTCATCAATGRGDARTLLVYEGCFDVITCVMVLGLWRSRARAARQEVEAATLKGESSCLNKLLGLVCDVVVELDGDLAIVEDSPKLSAMLTLGGRRASLEGTKLQAFLPLEEDRQRLERQLLELPPDEMLGKGSADLSPGVLPVKMRDSLGNVLDVELFYAQCHGVPEKRFFLGLREHSDEPISQLKVFRKKRRNRSPSRVAGQADSSSQSGSSDYSEEGDAAGLDTDAPGPHGLGQARLMEPRWRQTKERGIKIALVRAMARCNLLVEPTWCCSWHAAVASMKTCLAELEGYSCARRFTVDGNWQCAHCLAVERSSQSGRCSNCRERAGHVRKLSI